MKDEQNDSSKLIEMMHKHQKEMEELQKENKALKEENELLKGMTIEERRLMNNLRQEILNCKTTAGIDDVLKSYSYANKDNVRLQKIIMNFQESKEYKNAQDAFGIAEFARWTIGCIVYIVTAGHLFGKMEKPEWTKTYRLEAEERFAKMIEEEIKTRDKLSLN